MQPAYGLNRGSRTQRPISSKTSSVHVDPSVTSTSTSTSTSTPQASGRHHQTKTSISLTESAASPSKLQRARHQFLRPDQTYDDTPPVSVASSSNIQAPYFFEMPRSENVSPMMSANSSRRASLLIQKDGDDKMEPRDREGERGDFLSSGKLRQSLMELDAFSNDATRTLNDTCDAMSEQTAALQEIVTALKELAETTRDIHIGFERVSQELESDITNQLDSMGQFTGQQKTIELLQTRIQRGRRRIEALTARVEVVRLRVEGWEKADKLWQERTRKRLAITWTVLSVLALVVVVLLVFVDYSHEVVARGNVEIRSGDGKQPVSELQRDLNTRMANHAQTLLGEGHEMRTMPEVEAEDKDRNDTWVERKMPADDGEWMRAFDEL